MKWWAKSSFLLAAIATTFVVDAGSLASAQDTSSGGIGVRPAISEVVAQPGETATSFVTILNNNEEAVAIDATVDTFLPRDPEIDPAKRSEFDASDWISLSDEQILIDAKSSAEIEITATVPADVTPGGRYAYVSFRDVAFSALHSDSQVVINPQVTAVIFMTVPGDTQESLDITRGQIASSRLVRNNQSEIGFSIENSGNTHQLVQPFLNIYQDGQELSQVALSPHVVLPNTIRNVTETWPTDVGFGQYQLGIEFTFGTQQQLVESERTSVWVLPALIYMLGLGLVPFIAVSAIAVRKNVPGAIRTLIGRGSASPKPKNVKKTEVNSSDPSPGKRKKRGVPKVPSKLKRRQDKPGAKQPPAQTAEKTDVSKPDFEEPDITPATAKPTSPMPPVKKGQLSKLSSIRKKKLGNKLSEVTIIDERITPSSNAASRKEDKAVEEKPVQDFNLLDDDIGYDLDQVIKDLESQQAQPSPEPQVEQVLAPVEEPKEVQAPTEEPALPQSISDVHVAADEEPVPEPDTAEEKVAETNDAEEVKENEPSVKIASVAAPLDQQTQPTKVAVKDADEEQSLRPRKKVEIQPPATVTHIKRTSATTIVRNIPVHQVENWGYQTIIDVTHGKPKPQKKVAAKSKPATTNVKKTATKKAAPKKPTAKKKATTKPKTSPKKTTAKPPVKKTPKKKVGAKAKATPKKTVQKKKPAKTAVKKAAAKKKTPKPAPKTKPRAKKSAPKKNLKKKAPSKPAVTKKVKAVSKKKPAAKAKAKTKAKQSKKK